jgi:hypothetical protein
MRFNTFQWGIINALAWVICLADGWVLHNHFLFGVGLFLLIYSFWRMIVNTPEDEEFNRIEMESRIKQDYVRDIKIPTREQLMAEVTVLTELVRVLSDRVAELEKNT